MRAVHGARAPWYSLHNYYRVGSRGGWERERGGGGWGVERGGISYLFLTGIQDGESRPKDFCVTCQPLPCARHSREMDLLFSWSGEESIRGGSRAAWYVETRPWRAYGRVKGCSISPLLPIGTPFSRACLANLAMHGVDNEIFRNRSATRNLILKIWGFVQDKFKKTRGKFGDCKVVQIPHALILTI